MIETLPAVSECRVPDQRPLALVDLLDRVLSGGVVIAGEVTLSLAGVDLIRISLRALVASAGALESGHRRRVSRT